MKNWLLLLSVSCAILFGGYWLMTKTSAAPIEGILELTTANFEEKVLKSELPVLVDFWADWCGPCRQIAPIVKELSETYKGKFIVAKVDVDAHPNIGQQYGIRGIPTLLIFKKGKLADRIVGAVAKTQIESAMEAALK